MNLSDKDLDRLFREASDRFEPEDSMLSWNRLEKNLAGQLPERPPGPPRRFGFRPIVWVPAAVLFAGLSFFLIKNNQQYRSLSTLPPSTLTAPVSPASDAGHPRGLTSPATRDSANASGVATPFSESASAGTAAGSIARHTPPATTKGDRGNNARAVANAVPGKAAGNNNDLSTKRTSAATVDAAALTDMHNRQLAARERKSGGAPAHNGNKLHPEWVAGLDKAGHPKTEKSGYRAAGKDANGGTGNTGADLAENANGDKSNGTVSPSPEKPSAKISTADQRNSPTAAGRPEFASVHLPSLHRPSAPSLSGNDDALNKAVAAQKKLPLPTRSVNIRQPIAFGLVMGPDYTDGGITSSQFGNSLGISISYYLTSRLSINSGLLYGVKSYAARGRDFQPRREPLRNFGSYPHIESANGTVTMFEIPLSLRYDFPLDSKTRLFVNAGLSSYLPVRETFTTYFHDQGRIYGWRHVNNNPPAHWFAVGHFSGGVERDLGKGLSFQAEPYLNLPFTNVSAGNVKLKTYGLLFSIRYTPVLGRKKAKLPG